jgi:Fe-S-cluster containining protein
MHGYCNMCGKCCEAIRLMIPPEQFAEYGPNAEEGSNYRFVYEHWRNISEDEAFRRNPLLRMQKEAGLVNGEVWYYECDMYDPVTHKCKAHDTRPHVCRGYPFYGDDPVAREYFTWYSPTCDYIHDHNLPGERQLMIELALEMKSNS